MNLGNEDNLHHTFLRDTMAREQFDIRDSFQHDSMTFEGSDQYNSPDYPQARESSYIKSNRVTESKFSLLK